MAATPAQVGRLAAGAKAGTAGTEAFDEAQRNESATRNQAIAQMRREAAKIGAPGALTAQLQAGIAAPSATAIANLGAAGGYAANVNQQDQQGTDTYMSEANAALPLIRAEADRDLGQKIALLNASRSGGGGGGGGGGGRRSSGGYSAMSDSEVRNRLMGLAQNMRDVQAQVESARAQGQFGKDQELAAIKIPQATSSGYNPGRGSGTLFTQNPDERYHTQRQMWNNDTAGQQGGSNYVETHPGDVMGGQRQWLQNANTAYNQALQQLQARRFGPGIVNEARQIGTSYIGLDPAMVTGILPDSLEKTYLANETKLGRYTDPNKVTYSTQPMSAEQVSRYGIINPGVGPETRNQLQEHLPVDAINKAQGTRYFDWEGDSQLKGAFSKWVDTGGASQLGVPSMQALNTMAPDQANQALNSLHQAFQKLPTAAGFQKPIIHDLLADAQHAIRAKVDFSTWYNELMRGQSASLYPREFGIAATMALPLFQVADAQQPKTVTVPSGTPAPTSYGP